MKVSALREGLILHESRISEDLRPLHERLVIHYNNMIKDLPGESSGVSILKLYKDKLTDSDKNDCV